MAFSVARGFALGKEMKQSKQSGRRAGFAATPDVRYAKNLDARGEGGRPHLQQFRSAAGTEDLAAAGFQSRKDIGAIAVAPFILGEQHR
jgi:hypothetical protein